MRRFFSVALLVGGQLTASRPTLAQSSDSAAAQALFDQGKKLAKEGRFSEACPKFEESQRLDAGVGTLLNLATCYVAQGRTASAWARFAEAAGLARKSRQPEQEAYALEHAATLLPRLSNVVIRVGAAAAADTPGLEVRRDGLLMGSAQWGVPIPVDPGVLTVTATAPNHTSWQKQVTIAEPAATTEIAVPELESAPTPVVAPTEPAAPLAKAPVATEADSPASEARSPSHNARRVAMVALTGVGVVGVIVGSVYGISSKTMHDVAQSHCDGRACDEAGATFMNDARRAGDLSTVAFVVAFASLGGAALLWLTWPNESHVVKAQLGFAPGEVRLRGVW